MSQENSPSRSEARSINTFSIVARDPANGDLGLAVASKFLAAGATVPFLAAETGAIAAQALPGRAQGPRGLAMLRDGRSAPDVLAQLMAEDDERELRQVGIVDAGGQADAFTGSACTAWAGHHIGDGYCCQGNILTGPETVEAMAEAFESSQGALAGRLLAALLAGDRTGGDRRGKQSAALLVVRSGGGYMGSSDRFIDLRVDDAKEPCHELQRLFELHCFYFGQSPAADAVKIEAATACEVRDLLSVAGYDVGDEAGDTEEALRAALDTFVTIENLEERVDLKNLTIDPPALQFLRNLASAGND